MHSAFRSRVKNNNLRYWDMNGGDGSGPRYLNIFDLDILDGSDAIFVRKIRFDTELEKVLVKRQKMHKASMKY